jgi:cell division protease FtsH
MFKNLAVWLVIGLVLMTVFNQFNNRQVATGAVEYSQFIEEVSRPHFEGGHGRAYAEGNDQRRQAHHSYAPPDLWLVSDLLKNGVKIEARRKKSHPS